MVKVDNELYVPKEQVVNNPELEFSQHGIVKLKTVGTEAKGPSTNRFRPPIADLFRDGGRGLAFESAFKKKIRTKPQLVFIKRRQYKIQLLPESV